MLLGGKVLQSNHTFPVTSLLRKPPVIIAALIAPVAAVAFAPLSASLAIIGIVVASTLFANIRWGLCLVLFLAVLSPPIDLGVVPSLRIDQILTGVLLISLVIHQRTKKRTALPILFIIIFCADIASRAVSTFFGAGADSSGTTLTDLYWIFKPVEFLLILVIAYQITLSGLWFEHILQATAIGGIAASLLGIISYINLGEINSVLYNMGYFSASNSEYYVTTSGLRSMSTFGYSTTFSVYLALVIVLCLAVILRPARSSRMHKGLFIVALVFSIMALLMTGSRTGLIVLFVGLIIEMILARQIWYLFAIGGLALVIVLVSPLFFESRYAELFQVVVVGDPMASSSLSAKLHQWDYLLSFISGNSVIGYGRAKTVFSLWFDNYYLEVLFQRGIIGISVFLLMYGSIIMYSWRLLRKSSLSDSNVRTLAVALVGMTVVLLVASFSGSFATDRIGSLFWILVGVTVAELQKLQNSQLPAPKLHQALRVTRLARPWA